MKCQYCEDPIEVPSPLDLYHHCLTDHSEDIAEEVKEEYGLTTDFGYNDDGPQVGVTDFFPDDLTTRDHPMKLTTVERIEAWARFCVFQPGAPTDLLHRFECLERAVEHDWIIARDEGAYFSPEGRERLTTHVGKLEASIPFHEIADEDIIDASDLEHDPFVEAMDAQGIEPPRKLFKKIDPDITEVGYKEEVSVETYKEALEVLFGDA